MYTRLKSLIFIILSLKLQIAFAIYNGNEFSNIEDNLVFQIQLEQDNSKDYPCSATIISDFTFLTAAHCVDRLNIEKEIILHVRGNHYVVESLYIPLDYFPAQVAYQENIGTINEIKYHRNLALYDLAIINTKLALPRMYKRSELLFQREIEGLSVWVVGTGYTNFDKESQKFYNSPNSAHFRELKLSILDNEVYMVKGSNLNDFVTAPGDSGGSLYITGTNMQIGVLRGSSATPTKSASISTPVYLHQDFIQRFSK